MHPSIHIRRYAEPDETAVTSITSPEYQKLLREYDKSTLFVAEQHGEIVGWMHLSIPTSTVYDCFVFIYVEETHRRNGIGRALYREAEPQMLASGCGWWTGYPPSDAADKFSLAMGFDYTNTNSHLVYEGGPIHAPAEGIRPYRDSDWPTAPDIWSREYAAMHLRLGLPWDKLAKPTPEEREESRRQYLERAHLTYVLEADGKIVGIGGLFSEEDGIGMVAVDSAHANKGYGRRLVSFLTDEAIRRGHPHPAMYCEAGNDNAMHLYLSLGYRVESSETVAVKLR